MGPKKVFGIFESILNIFFIFSRPTDDGLNTEETILLLPRTGNNGIISGNAQNGNGFTGNGDILNRIQTSSSSDSLNDDANLERFVNNLIQANPLKYLQNLGQIYQCPKKQLSNMKQNLFQRF